MAGVYTTAVAQLNDYEVPQEEVTKEPDKLYIQPDCTLAAAHSCQLRFQEDYHLWRGRAPVARLPVVTSQPSGLFRALRNRRRRWGDGMTRPLHEGLP